jgi:hypothetical protein
MKISLITKKKNTVGDVKPNDFVNWHRHFGGSYQSLSVRGKGEPRD